MKSGSYSRDSWSEFDVLHRLIGGKIHILSPWRLVDYWNWTRKPDFDVA
ncbi:MAG: hypothetical protein JRG94_21250 [Deltaproteobacteria bacterium]|nr:hypothetical protein [Deltaproteobacteria bacterium]MBW2724829.1 hypothetical protein [Deltaproteobacteria bacterium]